jgi:hypothetical protein
LNNLAAGIITPDTNSINIPLSGDPNFLDVNGGCGRDDDENIETSSADIGARLKGVPHGDMIDLARNSIMVQLEAT